MPRSTYRFLSVEAFWKQRPCHLAYLNDASVYPALEYCNSLGASHVGLEGKQQSKTRTYTLLSVHAAIRHGDRHSMHSIKNYERAPIKCSIDIEVTQHLAAMKQYQAHMETQEHKRRSDQTFAGYRMYPNTPLCKDSQLTPIGAAQHVRNGLLFHKRYFEQLGLSSANSADIYKRVMVRSTPWSRCYQSAMALMYGFIGDFDVTSLNIEQAEDCRLCRDAKDMSCTCPVLADDVDRQPATYRQVFPDVMNKEKTSSINQHVSQVFDIGMAEVPPVSHIFDATMPHVCHALPLPSKGDRCLEPWSISYLHDTLRENAEHQAENYAMQKICNLKMLPLLKEISERMLEQASGKEDLKFVLYSGHDSTIGPLELALGFGNGTWPPYASRVVLELYSDASRKVGETDGLYVKVLYNGRAVTNRLQWCRAKLTIDELCPYFMFKQYVDTGILVNINEESYTKACHKPSLF